VATAVPTAQPTRHRALQAGQKRLPDPQKIPQEATVNPTKAIPLANSAKDSRTKNDLLQREGKVSVLNQAMVIKQIARAVLSQAVAPDLPSPEKNVHTTAELRITATGQNGQAITAAGMPQQTTTGRNARVILVAGMLRLMKKGRNVQVIMVPGLDRRTMTGRNGRVIMTNARNRPATKSPLKQEINFQKDRSAVEVNLAAVLVRRGRCQRDQAALKAQGRPGRTIPTIPNQNIPNPLMAKESLQAKCPQDPCAAAKKLRPRKKKQG